MTSSSSGPPRRRIQVAAAALVEGDRVLIVQRRPDDAGGGGWEFPGGKIEPNETPVQAVLREVEEELGIVVRVGADLGEVFHAYENIDLDIRVFVCFHESGRIVLHDHDAMEWWGIDDLPVEKLLAADRPFVGRLRGWRRSQSSS